MTIEISDNMVNLRTDNDHFLFDQRFDDSGRSWLKYIGFANPTPMEITHVNGQPITDVKNEGVDVLRRGRTRKLYQFYIVSFLWVTEDPLGYLEEEE